MINEIAGKSKAVWLEVLRCEYSDFDVTRVSIRSFIAREIGLPCRSSWLLHIDYVAIRRLASPSWLRIASCSVGKTCRSS